MTQHLSPPIYLILNTIINIGLLYYIIRSYINKEPRIYFALYVSFFMAGVANMFLKVIAVYWTDYQYLAEPVLAFTILAVLIGVIFGYIGVNKYGDHKRKRLAKGLLFYLLIIAILVIYVLMKY